MIEVRVYDDVEALSWDRRVRQCLGGGFRQTSMYAQYKNRWKESPLYFVARDEDGTIVGQLLAICGSPWGWGLERRPLSSVTLPFARWIAPHLYWHEGPLVFKTVRYREVLHALLCAVVREARSRRFLVAGGQLSHFVQEPEKEQALLQEIASGLAISTETRFTLAVDLTNPCEKLWSNVRKEARTKVRKAQKQGVEIEEIGSDYQLLQRAYEVVTETAQRNGVMPLAFEDFKDSYEYHSRIGVERSFLSVFEGHPVSYQKVVYYNGNALLGGVSYSDFSRERRLYGNDLMQWYIIEQGHIDGWRWLDFGGAEPNSPDLKMQGIYKFKAKWGGQLLSCEHLHWSHSFMERLNRLMPNKLHRMVQGG